MNCCNPQWAAVYAGRVRRMMNTYRRAGATKVYWLTLPATRSSGLETVAKTVNASISVAASAYGADVRVLDTVPIFTPGGKYRSAIDVNGEQRLVRESDGSTPQGRRRRRRRRRPRRDRQRLHARRVTRSARVGGGYSSATQM